ncbi:MAG TPA: (2Fe-2S)-binding protein [Gammaproteobacteria bacterium]|nr:(2Fe-2S)-binding protein [Gammaproteobacteria bacterium]
MPEYRFNLNGENKQVSASSNTTLLQVLRNELGVFSVRYGCGKEQCGACVVLRDGKSTHACTALVHECQDSSISTIEGQQHPLQQALIAENAGQCGYCLSGITMTAITMLEENPNPDRKQIQEALAGHLCRCGAHNRIIKAIERVIARG